MSALPFDWRNTILLATVHLVGIGGLILYLDLHGLTRAAVFIGVGLTIATIFSISAGYHRLFSHRTYEAHALVRWALLTVGAGAFQNSVLAWAADHRRHHARPDSPDDPYSSSQGFWHSHIGWVFHQTDPDATPAPMGDLERDPLVLWQQRYYPLIGLASGVVLPVALGFLFGDPWGGFIIGAAVRLLVVYHATFSINSFGHIIGAQPYSDTSSARDSFFSAIVSMGEGYHNYHHTFPADYRNGVGLHQFDPTKWILRALAMTGLVKNLRRAPEGAVIRARVRMDERHLAALPLGPSAHDRLGSFRAAIERSLARAQHSPSREARRELAGAYRSWTRALSREAREVSE